MPWSCLTTLVMCSCVFVVFEILKGCSKYFSYLNMHFSVFCYIVQKRKYLEKIGTNIAARPLCIETIFLLLSQHIVQPSFKGFIFVDFCWNLFNTLILVNLRVGGRGQFSCSNFNVKSFLNDLWFCPWNYVSFPNF